MTDAGDPYTRRPEDVREPPTGLRATLRHLGPGLILVGSVVGSGEIILTTTLGATVGFAMLWWILFSCWSKSIVQAELGRYSISSGETALQAFNRVPGRLTVGGVCFAALSPVVAGSTVYLRYRHTDGRLAPGWKSDVVLWICFLAMLGLGSYVVSLLFYGGV